MQMVPEMTQQVFFKQHLLQFEVLTNIGVFEEIFWLLLSEFWVPQIGYPLGDSSKKCSQVYFLLIVAMVLLYYCDIRSPW